MSLLMRRIMMAMEMEDKDMAEFKLLDTVTLTPSERQKQFDLSTYGYTEFLIHGNIPKTSNTTLFRIGIGSLNSFAPKNNSDVYAVEMIAHVHIVDGIAIGFVGYDSGWSGGNVIGALMNTPRLTAPGVNMNITFYPYVEGDEQAVIEIYGR